MIAEILRVLKRLSIRLNLSRNMLENLFWDLTKSEIITLDFDIPLSNSLIYEIKNKSEIVILSKLLELESKDVPYIVAAFNYSAILITEDIRSLYIYRDLLKSNLNIRIETIDSFTKSI